MAHLTPRDIFANGVRRLAWLFFDLRHSAIFGLMVSHWILLRWQPAVAQTASRRSAYHWQPIAIVCCLIASADCLQAISSCGFDCGSSAMAFSDTFKCT